MAVSRYRCILDNTMLVELAFMPTQEHKVCDVCHTRETTHHIVSSVGGIKQVSNLCNDCFRASATPEQAEFENTVSSAHCEYCGDHPCAGGTDFLALATGLQKLKFMCMTCIGEYLRYTQEELEKVPKDLSQEEQSAAIGGICGRADTHMKWWVSKKK